MKAGDGKFKEGAWVKIAEEYEDHPEKIQLAHFKARFATPPTRESLYLAECARWARQDCAAPRRARI